MNIRKILGISFLLASCINLSSCKSSLTSSSSNGSPDDGKLGEGSSMPAEYVDEAYGKISDGIYKGLEVVRIDPTEKHLVISLPLPLPFGQEKKGYFDNEDLNGSSWELKEYASNRWIAEIRIPLDKLVKGKFSDHTPAKLPNGDDLPGVLGGELPGFALKWEDGKKELFLYLGAGMAAIFIPSYEYDPKFNLKIPITSKKGKNVGYFALIPETPAYYGGFYLAALLPKSAADWIDGNLY